ncbi:MAG TPA: amylo-alpha-1,6-glucosidase, partial [Planctomycetota bacterium]|nr:amylo-alpha-1,6-glucosidase [Planctomycetota bacterium]
GWKDSCDSVFHADGTLAEAPVALCEVQGYVYGALLAAARLAAALGKRDVARDCSARADALRERFEAAFWCEDLDTYALALDARKRACRVVTSNPGHCLFAGIADPERAARVARTLCHGTSFSGWGVRTVAATEARYNPMSYHNGSVWPHDNAIIAAGFARYGFRDLALLICTGMFEASSYLDLHRLPELFCGFQRRPHEGPILYPLACAPQAWAAAAAYSLLQSILGLELDAVRGVVRLDRPTLPPWLETVRIEGLRLRDRRFDLALSRRGGRVEASISGSSDDLAFEFEP